MDALMLFEADIRIDRGENYYKRIPRTISQARDYFLVEPKIL
jgi:hypothetical protein